MFFLSLFGPFSKTSLQRRGGLAEPAALRPQGPQGLWVRPQEPGGSTHRGGGQNGGLFQVRQAIE